MELAQKLSIILHELQEVTELSPKNMTHSTCITLSYHLLRGFWFFLTKRSTKDMTFIWKNGYMFLLKYNTGYIL